MEMKQILFQYKTTAQQQCTNERMNEEWKKKEKSMHSMNFHSHSVKWKLISTVPFTCIIFTTEYKKLPTEIEEGENKTVQSE